MRDLAIFIFHLLPSEVIRWGHEPVITADITDKDIVECSGKSTQYEHDKIINLKIKTIAF